MFDLDRFTTAQSAPHAGFQAALAELTAGRKTSHWIWYVFPQLAGLDQLMGSDIDALKLISSMTLFRHVARTLSAADPRPEFTVLADHADAILAAAGAQGY